MGIKSELHEAILKRGGKVPPYGGIAAAMDELNKLPGGGGDCDWNIMKNKPFYKDIGEAVLLDNVRVNFEDGQAVIQSVGLTAGKTYAVTWSGHEFNCVAVQADEDTVVIGNMSVLGGDDTGEPFFIGDVISANMAMVMSLTGDVGVWVKVIGEAEIVHPLDAVFVPDGMVKIIDFVSASDGSELQMLVKGRRRGEIDAFVSSGEIYMMQKSGYQIIGRLDGGEKTALYQLSYVTFEGARFIRIEVDSDGVKAHILDSDVLGGVTESIYRLTSTKL